MSGGVTKGVEADVAAHNGCACRGAGYCPRWNREVSAMGVRICRGGDEASAKRYFGVDSIPPTGGLAASSPIGAIAPARYKNGRVANSVLHPWEGKQTRKPWDYRTSVAIAHLDTSELLKTTVALWQAQREKPYILIVDTGSLANHQDALDRLESENENVEVHRIRAKGWRATSQPVAVAMDLAFAVCQTEYLIATHTDVFPKVRNLAEWIVGQCDKGTPIVGWQMSPRQWPTPMWREIPSHSCTAYHMPTARWSGWRWNMLGAFERLGMSPAQPRQGFPDTEVMLGLLLIEQGIKRREVGALPGAHDPEWLCLGPEPNEPYENAWFAHARSTTVKQLYGHGDSAARAAEVARHIAEARARAVRWHKPRVPLGTPCLPCRAAKK